MPVKNGAKNLLWVGGGIAICISATIYLIQMERSSCPLDAVKQHLEQKIDFQYKIISEDISEIKEEIRNINKKLE